MTTDFTYEDYLDSLSPQESGEEFWKSEKVYKLYLTKHETCKRFNPQKIAEIGVRNGYSAYAFLKACPKASYYGFDLSTGKRVAGGVKGINTYPYVSSMLLRKIPAVDFYLFHADTQASMNLTDQIYNERNGIKGFYHNSVKPVMDWLPTDLTDFDFFHVDGGHTVVNCFHDMTIAMFAIKMGGVILVDDQQNIRIRKAINDFAHYFQFLIKKIEIKEGDHAIIWRNDQVYEPKIPWNNDGST